MQNTKKYKGIIVEESLDDKSILKDFVVLGSSVTDDVNPLDRWHMYVVEVDEDRIEKLSKVIKPKGWYSHFWNEEGDISVIFRDKIFNFGKSDLIGRKEAVEYGMSVGIPVEQLDFLVE